MVDQGVRAFRYCSTPDGVSLPGGGDIDVRLLKAMAVEWNPQTQTIICSCRSCYAGYQWFLQKLQSSLERRLTEYANELKNKKDYPQSRPSSNHSGNGRPVIAVWQARGRNALNQGIL